MGSPEWDAGMEAIAQIAKDEGVAFHELRLEVVQRYVEEGNWPKDEGLGSSDSNHILFGIYASGDTRYLRDCAKEVAERNKFRADLEAQGVDIEALRRLLATTPD